MFEATPTDARFPFVGLHVRREPAHVARHVEIARRTRPAPPRAKLLPEVVGWLFRAQDAAAGDGVAECFHLQTGWSSPSAQTAAAVILTLLAWDRRHPDGEALRRAVRLGIPENLIPAPTDRLLPFATRVARVPLLAQAILAWVALYERTQDRRFRSAALDVAHSLVELEQEVALRHVLTLSHHAVASWALLRAATLGRAGSFIVAAASRAKMVAEGVGENGYVHETFRPETLDPLLLRVTQTLHALLEAGLLAGNASWVDAARRGARRLRELYPGEGRAERCWRGARRPAQPFNCMAGSAQASVLWLRLMQQGYDDGLVEAALRLNRFIASTIDVLNPEPGIRGGVRAGHPLWVGSQPLGYRALAAGTALDAFLLEDELFGDRHSMHPLHLRRSAERGTTPPSAGGER